MAFGFQAGWGQENSWQSLAGEASAMSRKVSPEKIDYNLEVGPVLMKFKAGLVNGYSSNLQLTNSAGKGSAFSTPSITCNLNWPITDLNTLTFGMEGGYSYYWQAPQDQSPGGFYLSPTSALKGDFYVDDFKFTPSDAFSLQQNPNQATELSGVSKLSLFQNNLGLLITWDAGADFLVTAGASIFTVKAMNSSSNNYLDRNALSPSFSAQYSISPSLSAGINGSAQFNRYQNPAQLVTTNITINGITQPSLTVQGQNNSDLFQIGPFVHHQISEYITIDFDLGYLWGTYEKLELNQGAYPSTFYLDFLWSHVLNEYMRYSIMANRIEQPSVSNGITFFTQWTFGFIPSWKVIDQLSLTTPVSALIGEQSGSNGQKIQNYSGSINLGYQIMEKLRSDLGFTYLIKDSNQPNQSYSQWNASLGFTYDF